MTDDPSDRLLPYHDWCKTVDPGELRDRLEQRPEYRSNRVVSLRIFERLVGEAKNEGSHRSILGHGTGKNECP